MEIEQKYRVDDPQIFAQLLAMPTLGVYSLQPEHAPEEQFNSYLDTPDARLRATRHGLRIRSVAGKRIATLKSEGEVRAGRSQRGEWEATIGSDDAPAQWPASEVRTRVLELIGTAPVAAILTIHTTRHNIAVAHNSTSLAELSLDTGAIYAAGQTQHFRELEVELKGGSAADLDAICAQLVARFALESENRSKLARGLALLQSTPKEAK